DGVVIRLALREADVGEERKRENDDTGADQKLRLRLHRAPLRLNCMTSGILAHRLEGVAESVGRVTRKVKVTATRLSPNGRLEPYRTRLDFADRRERDRKKGLRHREGAFCRPSL